jgi:hypothetical protein
MKVWLKRIGIGLGVVILLVAVIGGGFVYAKTSAFDESMNKVYSVAPLKIERSTDPAVLARGKHIMEAIMPCGIGDCHGEGLSGGKLMEMGPLGSFQGPNVSAGGMGATASRRTGARCSSCPRTTSSGSPTPTSRRSSRTIERYRP